MPVENEDALFNYFRVNLLLNYSLIQVIHQNWHEYYSFKNVRPKCGDVILFSISGLYCFDSL